MSGLFSGNVNNLFGTMQADMGNAYSSISSMFASPSLGSPSKPTISILGKIEALPLWEKIVLIVVMIVIILAIGYLLMG